MIKFLKSDDSFDEIVSTDRILVDFYADWCGPCKMLGKVIENVDKIDVLKVNVDEFQDLAQKFGVMSIPTLILFEKGKLKNKSIGFITLDELNEFIK